jgi:hypothetical protein
MADTFFKIATVTVGAAGAASLAFTSVPQTYTDLLITFSGRFSNDPNSGRWSWVELGFNSDGAAVNNTGRILEGNGANASSSTNYTYIYIPTSGSTSNTFSNVEIYIPNYTSSTRKAFSIDSAQEDDYQYAVLHYASGLWTGTAAISSFTIYQRSGYNFAQYSTATLYGIKNS